MSALTSTAMDYTEQEAEGLMVDAVLLDPGFSVHTCALMPPAGLAWLETAPMSPPVEAAVRALAGDGDDRLSNLPPPQQITAIADPADAVRHLRQICAVASRP
ncbi:hypothetical protein ACFV0C_03595 [Streptomyces sp. NPDC059568]|uniref:hypothetical protein n=1 Tax=Streptomyces sp. NPDC059568 TaxID=3346868 RepID=UPI003699B97E